MQDKPLHEVIEAGGINADEVPIWEFQEWVSDNYPSGMSDDEELENAVMDFANEVTSGWFDHGEESKQVRARSIVAEYFLDLIPYGLLDTVNDTVEPDPDYDYQDDGLTVRAFEEKTGRKLHKTET